MAPDAIVFACANPVPEIWPSAPTRPKQRDPSAGDTFSDFTKSGKEPMSALIEAIYRDFNERNGTDVPVPK